MTSPDNHLPEHILSALSLDANATAEAALQLAEQKLKIAVEKLATLPPANPQLPKFKKDIKRLEPLVPELREIVHGRRVDEFCDRVEESLSRQPPDWTSIRDFFRRAKIELKNLPAGSAYHRRAENLERKSEAQTSAPAARHPDPLPTTQPPAKVEGETKVVTRLEALIDDGLNHVAQDPPDLDNAEKYLAGAEAEVARKPVPDKLKKRLQSLKLAVERERKKIARANQTLVKAIEKPQPPSSVKEKIPESPGLAAIKAENSPCPAAPVRPQRFELRADDGTRIDIFTRTSVRIGRHRNCEIVARLLDGGGRELREESIYISQYHALIEWDNDRCQLKDGGHYPKDGWRRSTVGLWVDGSRVPTDGGFSFVPDQEHRVTLGNPAAAGARRYELSARLWSVREIPQTVQKCMDVTLLPQSPACLVLRRLNDPAWVYLVVRSCAALAWADPRCGDACVSPSRGTLHLCEGQTCEPLAAGGFARAGSLNFQVIEQATG